MREKKMWGGGGVIAVMLIVSQVMDVGANTLSKAAMAKGMSNFVYITYTHAIAFFLLIPSSFLFHWKNPVPSISGSIILRLFLLGFICYCCSIFLFIGIKYSSPTLASAMHNLSPAFTFILAIIFRMEALKLKSQSSNLKIIGTLVSIIGAFIVIFYQGLPILLFPASPPSDNSLSLVSQAPNWVIGGFFLITSSVFLALLFIIKTWIVRDYPSDVLVTLIFFFFETIIAALVALFVDRDISVWMPTLDIEVIAIVAGGIVTAVIRTISTWGCRKKGPVFTAMFNPLQMIISVIMGISFLNDTLYLGSVIGGVVIALGFYTVMKGKSDEEMIKDDYGGEDGPICRYDFESSSHTTPLLPAKT